MIMYNPAVESASINLLIRDDGEKKKKSCRLKGLCLAIGGWLKLSNFSKSDFHLMFCHIYKEISWIISLRHLIETSLENKQ